MLLGMLVSKLGLSHGVSLAVVAAFTQGGGQLVAAMWPFIAPFVLTINGIMLTAGTAAVVGY